MSLEARLEAIRSGPVPPNEESAKFQVIRPILEYLGWDSTDGSEFLLEYPVGGKKGGRVDIALRANPRGHQRLVALIEAKAPGSDLNQHVTQVLGYAFLEGVDICVLTTGMEWWLFLPREPGDPFKRRFATLDLKSDSQERLVEDLNAFLGKEALLRGKAEKKAKSVLQARLDADHLEAEIPKIWKRMLNDPDEELVELVGARVYKKLNLRPEKGQVIAALRGMPVPTASVESTRAAQPDSPKPPKKKPRPSIRPVAFKLWEVRYPVSTHKAVLCGVADLLYERHPAEFAKTLELGKKRPFVSLDPKNLYAGSYYQVASSPYFITTHLNARAVYGRARLFLKCLGYDPSDLEVLFD